MALRKATLRRLPPTTREYAKLLGDLESVLRRGKNLITIIQRLEHDSQALAFAKERGQVEAAAEVTSNQLFDSD